jgi:hypothetical protein
LIQEIFPQACFVLPIRHPVEVAHSLCQRGEFTMDQGLKLWVVHVLEAERTTRGLSRLFTTYDQLMRSPIETVLRLAEELRLPTEEVAAAVAGKIDASLRHHVEPRWPEGEPRQELTLSIHQALISGNADQQEMLDRLRREYYGQLGSLA